MRIHLLSEYALAAHKSTQITSHLRRIMTSILLQARPEAGQAAESATFVFLRPLSIIHVDTEETWRGGQESLLTLARGLRARGYRQTIVCPPASVLAERAQADGFPIAKLGLRTADIVHAHSGRALTVAFWETARVPFRSGVCRVVTRHVAFQPRHPWLHRLKYTWTCDGDHRRFRCGPPRADRERCACRQDRSHPHRHSRCREPAPRDRSKFGLGEADFVIGHMGAFTAEKGQDVAVAAAALLRQSLPHAKVVLAGDGACEKTC